MRFMITILFGFLTSAVFAQQDFNATQGAVSSKESSNEKIYTLADKMASFPGGHNGWEKYLEKNLDYSIPVKLNAPAGRYIVIVMFIIDQKGNVNEIRSLTQHGFGMEDELIRVIKKGPRWSPAIEKGKAVKSYRKQPLTFVVRSI